MSQYIREGERVYTALDSLLAARRAWQRAGCPGWVDQLALFELPGKPEVSWAKAKDARLKLRRRS